MMHNTMAPSKCTDSNRDVLLGFPDQRQRYPQQAIREMKDET